MNECLPIKSIEEINLIKDLYRKKKQLRELLMFTLSINTGIDLSRLLGLKINDVKEKCYLMISPQKSVPLNNELQELILEVCAEQDNSAPLFRNRRGGKVDRVTIFYSFKKICTELGLSKKYSVVSWRKTFAYHYYQKYKDLTYLQWLFNQTSVEQALNFIGEVENINLRYREGVCL